MLNVLFVDDEPKLLGGLRRMLHSLRDEWNMEFASGGPQTLERMTQKTFDVVVSDMRMPGMDGSQLLEEIMTRFPTTVRIVLSGQCDRETTLKAVLPAHQFLTKPCDSTLLRATIERACRLQGMVTDDHLREAVSRVTSLPSATARHEELCANVNTANITIKQLAETIAADVGASAKVLQLVSSGFFGMPQKSIAPDRAVMLLGLETIQTLARSPHVFRPASTPALDAICIWITAHSIEVAKLAQNIAARETGDTEAALQAYVAGIFHDVGNLIFLECIDDSSASAETWKAERQHRTTKHAAIGGYLLGLWGLPDAVVDAAAFHHQPLLSTDTHFTALTAVHAANVFSQEINGEHSPHDSQLDLTYLEKIGCLDRLDSWREISLSAGAEPALR